jgi:hypothetical protein
MTKAAKGAATLPLDIVGPIVVGPIAVGAIVGLPSGTHSGCHGGRFRSEV